MGSSHSSHGGEEPHASHLSTRLPAGATVPPPNTHVDPRSPFGAVREYRVGEAVEVFSKTSNSWVAATVSRVDNGNITVDYDDRQKVLDVTAPNTAMVLRRLGDGTPHGARSSACAAARYGGGISPASSAGYQSPCAGVPPSAVRAESSTVLVRGFAQGERVEVWSNTKNAWLPAMVEQVFESACNAEGYLVPAGTLKVRSEAGVKWIMGPPQISATLRKFGAR